MLNEHVILNYMRKSCKINKITDKFLFNINFEEELEKGLLRPYANDFIEFAKQKYKPLELYLYTNLTYSWANDEIDSKYSKKINHTINLPIFTIENSIRDGGKSLSNVYEIIIKNLVNKYPSLKEESNIKEVFDNRLVFIDDIEFNLKDFPNKKIKCPEYNYEPPYANIKDTFKKKYNIDIYRFCSSKEIPIYSINGVNINQKNKLLYKRK